MPYPPGTKGIYEASNQCYCEKCDKYFDVEGTVDLGMWAPKRDEDMACPKCGKYCE